MDAQIDSGMPWQSLKNSVILGDRMAYCEDCRQRLSLSRRFFAAPQSGQSPDRENEEQGKDEEAQRASEHVTNNVLI